MTIAKAIEVGQAKVKEMAAEKEAKRIAALSPEDKKAEETKTTQAKQAEADKVLLEAKDETLDEAGKKRKAEVVESQKKAQAEEEKRILEAKDEELSEEDKPKKSALLKKKAAEREAEKEANVQRRIDEISSDLKTERAERVKDKEKILNLESELTKLKSGGDSGKVQAEVDRLEQSRIAKNLSEDKSLPREKRREMDDEELQEWLVEDMANAQRWLARQEFRRDRERSADTQKLRGGQDGDMKAKADAVIKKQAESNARVFQRHPELNVTKRVADMKAEGKSDKEIGDAIKNDPKCKLALEIIQEDQEKYLLDENGPELVAAEIERRLAKSPKGETQEERDKRIADEAVEAERQRQAGIDEGINSTRGKGPETKMSDMEKKQWQIFQKANPKKTLADFKANQERRKKFSNA